MLTAGTYLMTVNGNDVTVKAETYRDIVRVYRVAANGKKSGVIAVVTAGGVKAMAPYTTNPLLQPFADAVVHMVESGAAPAAGQAYAERTGKCYVCGRTLTASSSVEAGIGPECAAKKMPF